LISFHNAALGDTIVPEPSTIILIGSGLLGLAGFKVRKKKAGRSSAKGIFVTRWKHPFISTQQKKESKSPDEREMS